MQIAIPELAEIIKRLECLEKLLTSQSREPKPAANGGDSWMTGAEFRGRYRLGNDKLQRLVREGKVERRDDLGLRSPRYRMKEGKDGGY